MENSNGQREGQARPATTTRTTTLRATAAATRSRCARRSRKVRRTASVRRIVNHYLATQRKPLEEVEPIWILRWLLRKYFQWRGFACRSHCGSCDGKCYASIEYRGTFDTRAAARFAASCPGGEVKPIPFNAALPEETVQYGACDTPLCEASSWYREGVALPFVAIPREQSHSQLASLQHLEAEMMKLSEQIQGTYSQA